MITLSQPMRVQKTCLKTVLIFAAVWFDLLLPVVFTMSATVDYGFNLWHNLINPV